jgi:hypothetical protein
VSPATFTVNPDLFPPSKVGVDHKRTPRIEIFYLQPGGEYTRDDKLLDKVIESLKLHHEVGNSSTFDKEELATKDALKLKIFTSELIFAIVDDRDHSKDDVQRFVAQVHRFAALEAGVSVVCVV